MKKLKIYLDTSVISHLDAPDTLDKQRDTHLLWDAIRNNEYNAFISPVVLIELDDCPEPKRTALLLLLGDIGYNELHETDEVLLLAEKYSDADILPKRSNRDRQHIAYACIYNCDMLVSWNFKHLVNYKTISGIKGVNALAGYREMPIYTPTMLVSGGVENDS